MEASMHLRSCRVAHVLALAVIAVLTPACVSNKKLTPPNIQATLPVMLAGPVSVDRAPLLVFQFDRAMDPSTLTTANILITEVVSGNTFPISTLEYNATLNELRIIPGGLLAANTSYNVFATGSVTSSSGTQMGSAEGITITTPNPPQMASSFTWTTGTPPLITVTPISNTEIDLSWSTSANEFINITTPTLTPATHYDVYVTTVSGQYDWFSNAAPMFFTGSGSPVQCTGLSPKTQYFFKVVPRDDFTNIMESPPAEVTGTTPP
jgi:hypothetical protein